MPTATATTYVVNYTDVHTYDPFYKYIQCLTYRGIVGGFSDGTFRPNDAVTRGQAAKMVANAEGFSEATSGQAFSDVHPADTYYVYIERLAQRGLIGGYPDGTYRANQSITRGQLAKIASNAGGFSDTPPAGTQSFSDVPSTSTYYVYIERLSRRGIISGYQCGTEPAGACDAQNRPYYLPESHITRGETAKITANTFFPTACAPGRPQLKP